MTVNPDSMDFPTVAHFYDYGEFKAGYESIEGAQRHIEQCDLFSFHYKLIELKSCRASWTSKHIGKVNRIDGMYAYHRGIFFLFTEYGSVIGKCKVDGDYYLVYPNSYKIEEVENNEF